ncbi:unnamed protein product [Nesidiocoris tenuis]|uniref:Uncharacterized protein n=1 Tax=Nesidiocoris tenuis TaxID=355587 RepID=A0A6H5GGS8_9HEMI|nr:unnamed protein product [Nesidiocoris tenuis]
MEFENGTTNSKKGQYRINGNRGRNPSMVGGTGQPGRSRIVKMPLVNPPDASAGIPSCPMDSAGDEDCLEPSGPGRILEVKTKISRTLKSVHLDGEETAQLNVEISFFTDRTRVVSDTLFDLRRELFTQPGRLAFALQQKIRTGKGDEEVDGKQTFSNLITNSGHDRTDGLLSVFDQLRKFLPINREEEREDVSEEKYRRRYIGSKISMTIYRYIGSKISMKMYRYIGSKISMTIGISEAKYRYFQYIDILEAKY